MIINPDLPSKKVYSGPGINPNTGKSTVMADQAAAAQKALAKLTSGQTLTAAEKLILGISNTAPKASKPVVTAKPPAAKPKKPAQPKTTPAPIPQEPYTPPYVEPETYDPPTVVAPEPPGPVTWEIERDPVSDTPAIKSAPIDTVVFIDDEEQLRKFLEREVLFEDFAGQELINIARGDTVNGQDVIYQPFKNLNILQETYTPSNLLRLQETSDKLFDNFVIKLGDKIPKVGNGENGKNYYVEPANGDIVIELVNMRSDEQVEIQISKAGIIDEVGI